MNRRSIFVLFLLACGVWGVAPTESTAEPFQADPEARIAGLEALADAEDKTCATGLLRDISRSWSHLTPALRERARRAMPGAFPGPLAFEGPGNVVRGNVGCDLELASVVESEHFSVQWGPSVSLPVATAEYLLENLERIRNLFLDAGYPEPAGNPTHKVPFYFGNSGGASPSIGFSGGYTTMCNGGEHAYVVMSDMRSDDGSVELATHELFHAVQMGGPSSNPIGGWYWEASATWSEDFIAPDWNTYAWVLSAYTNQPDLPLADETVFQHQYGLFIFVAYLAEHAPGGLDLVRDVWASSSQGGLEERLDAFWDSIDADTDFPEQFGHFTAKTAFMDYEDGATYDSAPVTPEELTSPAELNSVTGPGHYGTHFYRVVGDGSNTKLHVEFAGLEDRDWIVAFARSADGRTVRSDQLYLNWDGTQSIDLLDIGTSWQDEVWVTVSRIGEGASAYDLRVEFQAQTEPPGSDLSDDPSGGRRRVPEVGAACGGDHPFAWPSSLAFLFAIPWLRRRRD